MHSTELLSRYPLISDQVDTAELGVLLAELEKQLASGVEGAIVELGCYVGTTSLFIRRLLDSYRSDREFHVYDSFEGLPEKTARDSSPAGEQFRAGELSVSKKEFLMQFKKAGLKPPIVHKAWFNELDASAIPDTISFAFLDGDYYESIRDSLRLIEPKLAPGAVIIVDDYVSEALPGAARAVDEWVRGRHVTLRPQHSLAIIST